MKQKAVKRWSERVVEHMVMGCKALGDQGLCELLSIYAELAECRNQTLYQQVTPHVSQFNGNYQTFWTKTQEQGLVKLLHWRQQSWALCKSNKRECYGEPFLSRWPWSFCCLFHHLSSYVPSAIPVDYPA